MSTSAAAVETLGLGKRYGRTWGLQDCSFRLPEGRIAGLVGPNGAGKSTLLRMLAGISTPSAGEMSVLGQRPGSQNADALARVGYLDQERPLRRRHAAPRWPTSTTRPVPARQPLLGTPGRRDRDLRRARGAVARRDRPRRPQVVVVMVIVVMPEPGIGHRTRAGERR